ncbi:MAG: hypothetical protein JO154_07495 [Chitinophaga sp.]|uniref:hypothetical protein n=1 Tax=Chitinophaga sp. TaxID=1869181 RepID=UPI0025B9E4C2|nr:hypothetical protein [Chitinophaga sp.]MBV8252436.1 hypothetical protein [Chitinophaga sp.]
MKSFYSNDYLIEVNEKRCAEYLAASQQFSSKFTVMIVIYSAISAFLLPVCKDVIDVGPTNKLLLFLFTVFALFYLGSVVLTFLLLFPEDEFAITKPSDYSIVLKKSLEDAVPKAQIALSDVIDRQLIKAYIFELERLANETYLQMHWKRRCYIADLFLTAVAVLLFVTCICLHFFNR